MGVYLENVAVGLVYIILPPCFIFINMLAITAMLRDKTMFKWPSYKVMTSMILSDTVQLIGVFMWGSVTVCSTEVSYNTLKVIGGIPDAFLIMNLVQGCILAVTRCSAIFQVGESLFEGRKVFIWIGMAYFYGLIYLVLFMTPTVNAIYSRDYYTVTYDMDDNSQNAAMFEEVSDSTSIAFMVLAYLVIAVKLYLTVRQTNAAVLNKKEKNAMLQSFIVCLSLVITDASFYTFPNYIPSKWATFACTFFWIFVSGVGGVLYIIFIKSVRSEAKRLLHGLFKRSNSVTTSTTVQAIHIPNTG